MTTVQKIPGITIADQRWPRFLPWIPGEVFTSEIFSQPITHGSMSDAGLGGKPWKWDEVTNFDVEGMRLINRSRGQLAMSLPPNDMLIEFKVVKRPDRPFYLRVWNEFKGSGGRITWTGGVNTITGARYSYFDQHTETTTARLGGLFDGVVDDVVVGLRFQNRAVTLSLDGADKGTVTVGTDFPDPTEHRVIDFFGNADPADRLELGWVKITAL